MAWSHLETDSLGLGWLPRASAHCHCLLHATLLSPPNVCSGVPHSECLASLPHLVIFNMEIHATSVPGVQTPMLTAQSTMCCNNSNHELLLIPNFPKLLRFLHASYLGCVWLLAISPHLTRCCLASLFQLSASTLRSHTSRSSEACIHLSLYSLFRTLYLETKRSLPSSQIRLIFGRYASCFSEGLLRFACRSILPTRLRLMYSHASLIHQTAIVGDFCLNRRSP